MTDGRRSADVADRSDDATTRSVDATDRTTDADDGGTDVGGLRVETAELPLEADRLAVDAELVFERDGHRFRLWSEEDRLVVDAPSFGALRSLADLRRRLPTDGGAPGTVLAAAGLTVDLQVRRATVARQGAGVRTDPVGRWLAGSDAAVRPRGVLAAAIRGLG